MTETPAEATYDVTTDVGKVRLLLNDIGDPWVFTDTELQAFLDLERQSVKLAAAQAIDANATNQALASKVIRDHELTTDGAKLADAMRRHADALRAQVALELEDSEDGFYFGAVSLDSPCGPELTGY